MRRSQELLAPTDVFVISDEVYEHMVFDAPPATKAWRASRAWPRAASS
jgi:aspartate/methionine/tyrosine aminotransferase